MSVIMANYKTKIEYLQEAINSILSQTYKNFELLIIDDCSQDNSVDYIKSINDDRIKLFINEKNSGPAVTRNRGLEEARGKYIAIMDSDDIALPTRFERQVEFMENNPDVFVCGTWFEKFGIENTIREPVITNHEMYRCQLLFSDTPITLCSPSAMIRKSMLDDNGIKYDETLLKTEDYGLWVDCSKHGKFYILKEVLLKYRTHTTQTSIKDKDEQSNYANFISRRQLQELGIEYCLQEDRWRFDVVSDKNDYLDFYRWISQIEKKNIECNYLDVNALKMYLYHKLCNAVKRMKKEEMLKVYFLTNSVSRKVIRNLAFSSVKKRIYRIKNNYFTKEINT